MGTLNLGKESLGTPLFRVISPHLFMSLLPWEVLGRDGTECVRSTRRRMVEGGVVDGP